MSETQTKKASLTMWTESRKEAQHWIPPGHGKGGKRHSQQCPAPTGTFLLCSSTPPPFLQDGVPKTIFHCSPNEPLLHGILGF